jgi:hypothetical protein
MEFLVLWAVFCGVPAALASNRGRNPGWWFLISFVLSPILASILVLALPNQYEEQKRTEEIRAQQAQLAAMTEARTQAVTGGEFALALDKIHQLRVRNILSEAEFEARKQKMLSDLNQRMIAQSPEDFLSSIVSLIDSKIINESELQALKAFAFSARRS